MAELSGRHVILPDSRAPIVAEPHVLVVGGGSAGLAAAATAAGSGAQVMLVERLRKQGAILE